jgi:glucan 1,3-beta-glucosidase
MKDSLLSRLLAATMATAIAILLWLPLATARQPVQERQVVCQGPVESSPKVWWRAEIEHNGTTPYAIDSTYQYYRTVVQYGADKTGVEDSSKAFNDAINGKWANLQSIPHRNHANTERASAWSRTAKNVTIHPAYVFVPAGRYLIKNPIQMPVNTFLIGDALSPPTLVADAALETNPVIHGYDENQGEGSANKNFYMAVRNFYIDTASIGKDVQARAMDWSVSQGCSLTNVHITMPTSSNHTGITMKNGGSGNIISDCVSLLSAYGLRVQQNSTLTRP